MGSSLGGGRGRGGLAEEAEGVDEWAQAGGEGLEGGLELGVGLGQEELR